MAAAVEIRWGSDRNSSPELEVAAAALGLRVRGWPPTRTLAQYKYGAAGWNMEQVGPYLTLARNYKGPLIYMLLDNLGSRTFRCLLCTIGFELVVKTLLVYII
jgi:hypothetical protein